MVAVQVVLASDRAKLCYRLAVSGVFRSKHNYVQLISAVDRKPLQFADGINELTSQVLDTLLKSIVATVIGKEHTKSVYGLLEKGRQSAFASLQARLSASPLVFISRPLPLVGG